MSKLTDGRLVDFSRRLRVKLLLLCCFWSVSFPLANLIYRSPPAVFYVVGVAYLTIGLWIQEYEHPKKAAVLFLRRFSNRISGHSISRAVTVSLGSYYRVITLAGGDLLQNARVPRVYQGSNCLALLCTIFGVGTGLAVAIKLNPAGLHGEEWGYWLGRCILTNFATIPVILGMRYMLFGRRLKVVKEEHLKRLTERVGEWTSSWARGSQLFPSLIIVTAADTTWRSAVVLLADNVAAVVVDVSIPSPHLAWEMDVLEPRYSDKTVLIASADQLATITSSTSVGEDASAGWWRHLIRNRNIIAYTTTGKRGGEKIFAEQLLFKIDYIFSRMSEARRNGPKRDASISLSRVLQIAVLLGCVSLLIAIMTPLFRRAVEEKFKEDEALADSYRKQNPKAISEIDIFDYSEKRRLRHIDDPVAIQGFVAAFADLKPGPSDSSGFSRAWIIKISGSEGLAFHASNSTSRALRL